LRRLWTAEEISHDGPYYPMDEVRIHPAPSQGTRLPVLVAGRQEPAMRRAALLGDGWMPYLYSARRYQASVDTVRAHAARVGRDLSGFSWSLFTPVNIHADGDTARREAAQFLGGTYDQSFEEMIGHVAVAGTIDEVARRLTEYVAAGARHFIFMVCSPGSIVQQARLLLNEVLPQVR
jgi:alkanesulfonate monooxygenase SsuD/methylene tetrahydromethanopterin reductase-like flavin-dependent oxidoreductase (luciferase family)